MQTQYKVLYRYINPTTNTAITSDADYKKTEEFFTEDHKVNITKDILTKNFKGYELKYEYDVEDPENYATKMRNEGDKERELLITENMANQDKSNNLYVYNGTKKIFHPVFVPEALGYVVREWRKVPKSQIPSGPDDYSKHFVMLGGSQLGVDEAYLVCKPQYFDLYKTRRKKVSGSNKYEKCILNISTNDRLNIGYGKNIYYYQRNLYLKNYKDIINEECFFKWYDNSDESIVSLYGETPVSTSGEVITSDTSGVQHLINKAVYRSSGDPPSTSLYYYIFIDNDDIYNSEGSVPPWTLPPRSFTISNSGSSTTYTGWVLSDIQDLEYYKRGVEITVNGENIIRDIIPEHYEAPGDPAYIIKDEYKKIDQTPWIHHSTHNSLESALECSKKIISMIGIKNVKLIKYVPYDQFVKIK